MPLPLNQITKRLPGVSPARGGLSAAYAVPVELNMEISGGMPTIAGTCADVRPLRKIRRDRRGRLVMTCDICSPPRIQNFPGLHQGNYQFLEVVVRFTECFHRLVQQRPV